MFRFIPEDHERDQGAESGGGQPRQDRQRVNVALVTDAQDDVDDENRDDEQDREVAERVLKADAAPWNWPFTDGGRTARRRLFLTRRSTSPSAAPGAEPEGNGHRRQLPVVADRLGPTTSDAWASVSSGTTPSLHRRRPPPTVARWVLKYRSESDEGCDWILRVELEEHSYSLTLP